MKRQTHILDYPQRYGYFQPFYLHSQLEEVVYTTPCSQVNASKHREVMLRIELMSDSHSTNVLIETKA